MKNLLACLALCASLSASAQVVYPYNPDANGDSAITSGDLLDFLPVFATSFTPQGITIDGVPLDEWLANLEGAVNSNAVSIESLFAMQAQINSLEAANSDLQNQINSLQNHLDNLSFSVDSLPSCVDNDLDGICDYADACPPIAVQFEYQASTGFFTDTIWSDYLAPNESYYQAQLYGANLNGACLIEIRLIGADLSDADLIGTNLFDADLRGANLSGADLSGANLSNADLSNADLAGATLIGADLESTDLESTDLSGAYFTGAYLSWANLSNANLVGANLEQANLSWAYLEGADLTGAQLSGATMTCLQACPLSLPTGYSCEPHPECVDELDFPLFFDLYRIVEN